MEWAKMNLLSGQSWKRACWGEKSHARLVCYLLFWLGWVIQYVRSSVKHVREAAIISGPEACESQGPCVWRSWLLQIQDLAANLSYRTSNGSTRVGGKISITFPPYLFCRGSVSELLQFNPKQSLVASLFALPTSPYMIQAPATIVIRICKQGREW